VEQGQPQERLWSFTFA